ncbi:MAG: hypothetical protein ACREOO_20605 [bacterium]
MYKALFSLSVAAQLRRQEFEGNEALELGVFGFVDDAHAATAELFEDFVMRNGLTKHFASRKHSKRKLHPKCNTPGIHKGTVRLIGHVDVGLVF